MATIITNLFICHIIEPHVWYKYALHSSTKPYYIKNYICIAIFTGMLIALNYCMVSVDGEWLELLINGSIAVGLALIPCTLIIIADKDFRHYLGVFLGKIKRKLSRKKSEPPSP